MLTAEPVDLRGRRALAKSLEKEERHATFASPRSSSASARSRRGTEAANKKRPPASLAGSGTFVSSGHSSAAGPTRRLTPCRVDGDGACRGAKPLASTSSGVTRSIL